MDTNKGGYLMAGENCEGCVKPLCNERKSVCNSRFEQLERNQGELYGLARESVQAQARADGKVDVLLSTVQGMDKNLFAFLQQQAKSQEELQKQQAKSQDKERRDWKELIKYVIGITIGVIVAYVFIKGA